MKVVILCGGEGTRLNEYTKEIPKPLVEIGGKPILWHIMKIYYHYGFNEFILCLGYKGELIKEYFDNCLEEWKIRFVDTGQKSNKAERLLKIKDYLDNDEHFFLAYGDDVAAINIKEILDYHLIKNKIVTLTTIDPKLQFGVIEINKDNEVVKFKEKPRLDKWINGGFFVLNRKIFDYIKKGYDLEKEVFENLAKERQICAFKYDGFWKSMNTFKDVIELNNLWQNNKASWQVW